MIGFPEPLIQFGKLAVVEVSPRDANAIDVAASLVEGLVRQRAPQVDANEIPPEYRGEISGHGPKKLGQILLDIFREIHSSRKNISTNPAGRNVNPDLAKVFTGDFHYSTRV